MRRWWAVAFVLLGCSRLPTPPEGASSVEGLVRDPATGIYSDSTGAVRFADVPRPFRDFFAHCSDCHSNRAANTELKLRAKSRMNVNNWEEIVAFGPSRLIVAASAGSMPPGSETQVPDTLLEQTLAFVASWSRGGLALQGTEYLHAQTLVGRYCADCHTANGRHADQPRAWSLLPLDTYAQWRRHQDLIAGRLAPDHPGGALMPPAQFPAQPSAAERGLLLDWIARNSPNSADGSGVAKPDTTPKDSTVMTGSLTDVAYLPAQRIVNRYCADCHTQGGRNKDQVDAWKNADIKLDTHAGWVRAQNTLAIRLEPSLAASQRPFPLDPMPKPSHPFQPTRAERDTLLAWLKLGSPNTPTGE